MRWLHGVLIAVDQLGNAVAGGNPDLTISARVGYQSRLKGHWHHKYWVALEKLINFTFYPIDGPNHCKQAYESEEDYSRERGSDVTRAILSLIVIPACIIIAPVIRIIVLLHPQWGYKPQNASTRES